MNWQELSVTSQYQTAMEIKDRLQEGDVQEATLGIEELIEALSRSEKRALKSHLVRLMMRIIKWKSQPERQSRSWSATIQNAREEIFDIQEETPSLTNDVILELWEKCFRAAKREAEGEMNQKSHLLALSWQEVFEEPYELE
jgi:hypothetical protein